MSDPYSRLHRSVLAVLVEVDPLELSDPAITLEDEYDAEAREIARRVLGASADPDDLESLIQDVFVEQLEMRISGGDLARVVRAVSDRR